LGFFTPVRNMIYCNNRDSVAYITGGVPVAAIKETKPKTETKAKKYAREKSGGAECRFKEYHIAQAKVLAERGLTNAQMAEFWGICKETLRNWRSKSPELNAAIEDGKNYSNEKVKQALYNRAVGFETIETKEETGTNGSKSTIITRQVPAEVAACRIWLYNRDRANWSDNKKVELSLTDDFGSLLEDSNEVE
jgi:hypothetical protein